MTGEYVPKFHFARLAASPCEAQFGLNLPFCVSQGESAKRGEACVPCSLRRETGKFIFLTVLLKGVLLKRRYLTRWEIVSELLSSLVFQG